MPIGSCPLQHRTPGSGARPLRRALQRYVENPLSQRLLSGDITPGSIISIDLNEAGDNLVLVTKVPIAVVPEAALADLQTAHEGVSSSDER